MATVIPVYNSKYIKQPLTTYSDIARSDLAGRVVIPTPVQDSMSLYLLRGRRKWWLDLEHGAGVPGIGGREAEYRRARAVNRGGVADV